MANPTVVDDALDGIRDALTRLIEDVADEIEGCGRYDVHVDQDGHALMEPDSRGDWLDRRDILDSIRRLAR